MGDQEVVKEILTLHKLTVDSTEQPIERPTDNQEQKEYFSGKKKNHTLKNQLIVLPKGQDIVDVTIGEKRPVSELKIFREQQKKFDPNQKFKGDKAYIGGFQISTPHKKPKNQELSLEQKEENKIFSANRIFVEHLIGKLKNFRIAAERFRLIHSNTEIIPQLATELPKISADEKTYTIPIRQGVKFHDCAAFNAEAMAFSLRRFAENGGSPSSLLSGVMESVKATGEYELTITLKKPFAAFTALLTFPGLCAVSPQAYEIGQGKFKSDSFIGTGPYKLASYGTDSIKLEANPDYWGEKPLNKGVDIQQFSSTANVYNAFLTGAIDLTYGTLDLDQVANLESQAANKGWQVISGRSNGIYVLTMNLKNDSLAKPEVRQAIASLINRPLFQNRVFRGQIEPLYSLIPTTLTEFYQPVFQEKYGDGDIAKVKAALEKAGYSAQNPLKLEIWYRSNLKSNGDVAMTIKAFAEQQLSGAIAIELKSVESATAYNNLDKGVYPMFILDWSPDFLDPDNYIQPFLSCGKGSATTGCESGESQLWGSFYYSDRVNELIAQQRQEQNPQKRQEIFTEIQQILAQDIPFIPLWQGKAYIFAQQNLQNVILEPTQRTPFWTISKQ